MSGLSLFSTVGYRFPNFSRRSNPRHGIFCPGMFIITPGNHNSEEIAPIDVDCPFKQCRTKPMKASAEETSIMAAWAFASLQSSSSDSAHCLVWAIHSQTCNRLIFDADEATGALLPIFAARAKSMHIPKLTFFIYSY